MRGESSGMALQSSWVTTLKYGGFTWARAFPWGNQFESTITFGNMKIR
jgi:hypothetical protein